MSAKWIGRRLSIGIGKESSRGIGASPTFWLNALSFSHFDRVKKARMASSFGSIAGVGDAALVAQKWAEGAMEVEMGDKSMGLILLSLFGAVSSAVKETTAYNHTFTLSETNQHQSLSLHTTDPISDLLFLNTMIESLTINITPDKLVSYTVEFKSKNSAGNIVSKSYVAENRFIGRHLNFYIAANTGALAAAAKIKPKSLKLVFRKNIEIDNALGTVQPIDLLNRTFTVTGEIQLNFEDRVYANYMLNGDYKAVRVNLQNTDVTIGASSNPTLKIDFSKVDFETWEPDHAIDDITKQKIMFTALYDLSGNNNMINSCVLTNETTSY